MEINRSTKPDAGFSMSSMTDIVFLLLIFFLVTSTLINPNALKLLLPKSDNQVNSKAMVSVSIMPHENENGTTTYTYHINGDLTPIAKGEIEETLVGMIEKDETFSIHADKTVPIQEVVDLMNIAKDNDFKVILATTAK